MRLGDQGTLISGASLRRPLRIQFRSHSRHDFNPDAIAVFRIGRAREQVVLITGAPSAPGRHACARSKHSNVLQHHGHEDDELNKVSGPYIRP